MLSHDYKTRFSNRVSDYVKYRPHYPPAVLDLLHRTIALQAGWVVADIGSGTGISAELFLEFGCQVYAVEPNAEMRAAAESILGDRPGFHSVDASAEATTLPDASVDLVLAAQAWHWFDHAATVSEFRRIARPGCYFAAMWNQRLRDSSPFLKAYDEVLHRLGVDYQAISNKWEANVDNFSRIFGVPFRGLTAPNQQRFDFEGLKGRSLSSSYVPQVGQQRHDELLFALHELFDRYQQSGLVTFDYTTEIFVGQIG